MGLGFVGRRQGRDEAHRQGHIFRHGVKTCRVGGAQHQSCMMDMGQRRVEDIGEQFTYRKPMRLFFSHSV